jgi:hypothetical protein
MARPLEKLIIQVAKKFSAVYGPRRFKTDDPFFEMSYLFKIYFTVTFLASALCSPKLSLFILALPP